MHESRDFSEIADKIIKIIKDQCDFGDERVSTIINEIEKIKSSDHYRAPELKFMSLNSLADLLTDNFNPSNSKWEMELLFIFNDLSGSADEYWNARK